MTSLSATVTRRSLLGGGLAVLGGQTEPVLRLDRRVRVALIGLEGHTGEILRPLPQLPDVEIVALADPDEKALAAASRNPRLKSARIYTDYRRLLDREQLDIAAICGPNGGRAERILAAIERGLHVVAEKPLAIELEELDRIEQALRRRPVRLSMLLPMRFSPPYLALKQVVDSGEIGEVGLMTAQKSYKLGDRAAWYRKRETYGGTIPWIGIHMVDLMRWTSGRELVEAVSFQAHFARSVFADLGDMENVTGTLFRLDNGGAALLNMDYLRPQTAPTHGDDRLRLAGTKGVAEYQAATGVTVVSTSSKPRVIENLPPARSLFVDFLQSVYLGAPPGLALQEILRVNRIVLLARQAAEQGRIVKL
ncbi:MAG: Gfo/Idh/MocA family oxidoreductase [Bryobacterales bacterium]|nr:Gfo/Idh/MocA family oxidoreductase [Bryobacteraceae bacterium]MDW8130117.1 Gfo/Idh/MocA family oxidoreductase [Bryobacterales bacterium]